MIEEVEQMWDSNWIDFWNSRWGLCWTVSRPDPRLCFYFSFSQGVMWVGILCCMSRCCVAMFRPGMGPNQRQLVIVVSDWEPYLGSLFSHYGLWVVIFRFSVFSCSFVFSVLKVNMNTYHAAPWSSPSSTHDSRYNARMITKANWSLNGDYE